MTYFYKYANKRQNDIAKGAIAGGLIGTAAPTILGEQLGSLGNHIKSPGLMRKLIQAMEIIDHPGGRAGLIAGGAGLGGYLAHKLGNNND